MTLREAFRARRLSRRTAAAVGLSLAGLALGYARIGVLVAWMAESALGAEAPATPGTTATLATFADMPGVTPAYVEAYNAYVQARYSDRPVGDYTRAIDAFTAIAQDSPDPELRLRSAYFLTLCHALQGQWHDAYTWSERVLAQVAVLHADDPRTQLALRLADRAKAGEVSLRDARIVFAAQLGADNAGLAGDLAEWHQECRRLTPGGAPARPSRGGITRP
ncbi:MAG: hypothetical protein GX595_03460 [Lentisphaerae bacterium]|nr:hypothetical protein [Lentisphaerota bacterium]